jgi:hypothetical protein
MKQKRKRAPGGGRKPGEFGKLGAVMGLRLPEELKEELEQVAKESGRSLSGEMIWQLRAALTSRRRGRKVAWEKKVYQALRKLDFISDAVAEVRRDLGLKPKGKQ